MALFSERRARSGAVWKCRGGWWRKEEGIWGEKREVSSSLEGGIPPHTEAKMRNLCVWFWIHEWYYLQMSFWMFLDVMRVLGVQWTCVCCCCGAARWGLGVFLSVCDVVWKEREIRARRSSAPLPLLPRFCHSRRWRTPRHWTASPSWMEAEQTFIHIIFL